MSRRRKQADPEPGKARARRPPPKPQSPLPEVVLARRPISVSPPSEAMPAMPALPEPLLPNEANEAPVAPAKRAARIVGQSAAVDDTELERRRLLSRLLQSEGPAVTRAANAYKKGGFEFPDEQLVQLKLLEHSDETEVCRALDVLTALLDDQPPVQLPVFEQRLKRLEDGAENQETRLRAGELRRVLRT